MLPRTNYEMTEEVLKKLLDSCKPTPVIIVGGVSPDSPQKMANDAWNLLGIKMGFDSMSVRPVDGKGMRFFTAIPTETEEYKTERIKKQENDKLLERINNLRLEISEKQNELRGLEDLRH